MTWATHDGESPHGAAHVGTHRQARPDAGVTVATKMGPQAAIAWLWQHPEVSSVIPAVRNVGQARSNAAAGRVYPLGADFDAGVRRIYDTYLREAIHPRW